MTAWYRATSADGIRLGTKRVTGSKMKVAERLTSWRRALCREHGLYFADVTVAAMTDAEVKALHYTGPRTRWLLISEPGRIVHEQVPIPGEVFHAARDRAVQEIAARGELVAAQDLVTGERQAAE